MSDRSSNPASWSGLSVPQGVTVEKLPGGLGNLPDLRFASLPVGVRASAHRDPNAPDLALLDVGRPVTAAIVTTTNRVKAAPCLVGIEHVASGDIRAVIVNSGNANACTGQQGLDDARATTDAVARALGCASQQVVPMSTGVIGVPLPVDRILAGVPGLVELLASGSGAASAMARAMMTTDTRPKQAAVRLNGHGHSVTVAGVAKGAGMIEPAMATMLSILVTDARLDAPTAERILQAVTDRTFNRISVDSCGSTNDTVLLLATGTGGAIDDTTLEAAVELVSAELAHSIVSDGEGVTRIAHLQVSGAPDAATAREIGRSVAASALFRTALHGSDPNWGRVLAAMGASSATFDPERVSVRFGDVTVCRNGGAVDYDHEAAVATLRAAEVAIEIDLDLGDETCAYLVSDLSAGYVHINAEYTT